MPRFIKDVLKPGSFRVSETEGVTFEKSDLERMVSEFDAMRAAGLAVPVPWEHPDINDPNCAPVPEKEREQFKSKFNAGWLERLFIEGDELKAEVDIPLEDDAAKLENVGTFVSPQIGSFVAGDSTQWKNVVKHLALTTKPVNARQSRTFTPVSAVSLSRDVRLSIADQMTGEDQTEGADHEGEEVSKQGDSEGKEDPQIEEFRQAMLSIGVTLPAMFKLSGDLPVLVAAVVNAAKRGNDMSKDQGAAATKTETPALVSMSREDHEALKNTAAQNAALIAEVTKTRRAGYVSRIEAASGSGRCSKATADSLTQLASAFNFSVGSDQKGELDITLELIELNPEGTFWSDTERVKNLSIREVNPSALSLDGDGLSDEEADKLVDQMHPKMPTL